MIGDCVRQKRVRQSVSFSTIPNIFSCDKNLSPAINLIQKISTLPEALLLLYVHVVTSSFNSRVHRLCCRHRKLDLHTSVKIVALRFLLFVCIFVRVQICVCFANLLNFNGIPAAQNARGPKLLLLLIDLVVCGNLMITIQELNEENQMIWSLYAKLFKQF